jgi:hypothetical protein
MITDFPEAKNEMKKAIDTLLQEQIKQKAPTLSMIGKKTLT